MKRRDLLLIAALVIAAIAVFVFFPSGPAEACFTDPAATAEDCGPCWAPNASGVMCADRFGPRWVSWVQLRDARR